MSVSVQTRKYLMNRPLRKWFLRRLAADGPARPCELMAEFNCTPGDTSRVLLRLTRRGVLTRTRIVTDGMRGGNVASVYQLR
jgi:DNA-binding MarR family transcriptional regulator